MVNKDSETRQKKADQIKRIYELLGKYKQIILVTLENVGSNQCQQIRRDVYNNGGILLIGKNTVIKKAIQLRLRELDASDEDFAFLRDSKTGTSAVPELEAILPLIKDKIGFIFSDRPVFELKPIIEANQVQAPAKVGIISNIDVVIPPGPTGMDPSQIAFFHALSISTKIQKGQIEITKDYQVCTVGKKIGNSEVALLQKMNLKPFSYQMNVFSCYDNGSILNKDILAMSASTIMNAFQTGVKNIAALSLETGIATEASIPYSIVTAFKNLAAIGIEANVQFKQLTDLQSGASSAASQQASTKAPAKQAAAKVEEKVEEPEEDVDMGGLFD